MIFFSFDNVLASECFPESKTESGVGYLENYVFSLRSNEGEFWSETQRN